MDSAGAMVAGVDEAGRGPLAGPVVAAAVILPRGRPIDGLDDSKRLSPLRRRRLEPVIKERALRWHVAFATVAEIDRLNILKASLLAMRRAVEGLGVPPALVLVDGFISAAAALAACRLCPGLPPYLVASHRSTEPGHAVVLDSLGLTPILDLEMRLGEGTGCALAIPGVRAAGALLREMATFESAGISGPSGDLPGIAP